MKKHLKTLVVLFLVSIFLIACKDDKDEQPSVKNKVSYNGTDYVITNGYFYNDDELHDDEGPTGTYRMEVYLTSGMVNDGTEWSGTGTMLYLTLHTSSPDGVVEGTYTVVSEDAAIAPLQASVVAFATDFNASKSLVDEADVATSGTVVVKKSGNEFTYDVNVKMGDKTLVGNYTGAVPEIE